MYLVSTRILFNPNISTTASNTLTYQFFQADANTPPAMLTVNKVGNVPELTYGTIPESGNADEYFTFQVIYKDQDGDPPWLCQAWVDENGDGIYQSSEKYPMYPENVADKNYKEGVVYTQTVYLSGASQGQVSYRFYFHDGKNLAKGDPTHDRFLFLNHRPVLESPKVDPVQGEGGSDFTFQVTYRDLDNDPPQLRAEVWVDENGNGVYEPNERYPMWQKDMNKEFMDGVCYEQKNIKLHYAVNAEISTLFYFSDRPGSEVKLPGPNLRVTQSGSQPLLSWVNEAGYQDDGVDPNFSMADANFSFKVRYQDTDYIEGDPLPKVELWVDRNTDQIHTITEKYTLSSSSSSSFTTGRIYSLTQRFTRSDGDGVFTYRFWATDGKNIATGVPSAGGKFYINPHQVTLAISGTPGKAYVGTVYSFTPTVSGGVAPLTFSLENGPSWLTINSITGALSGTPTIADIGTTIGVVITVTDAATPPNTDTLTFDLTVVTATIITVNPTSGLMTTESGGTATFTIILDTQPVDIVTIALSASDPTEGDVSPTSITFTPDNWHVAQTVTIMGVDDSVDDGDIAYTITTHPAISGDPIYNGLDPEDVSVTNLDNDPVYPIVASDPVVYASDPTSNQINVPLTQVITIIFTSPMDFSTTADAFHFNRVGDNEDIVNRKEEGTLVIDGAILTFTPSSNLLPGTTYWVKIKSTATDLEGYPLDGDYDGIGGEEDEDDWKIMFTTGFLPVLIELDKFTAVPLGNQISITWTTLSEIDNAGFNLWRSEAKDGKYIKINPKIIEATGGATLSVEYSYIDTTAKPGITYYYKLEDIDIKGASTFHGPVSTMISTTKSTVDYYPLYWFGMYLKPVWPPIYYTYYTN